MPYIDLSMGGVEWDAIEYPSQIMENWCWESEVLKLMSEHVDTGKSISDKEIEILKRSKLFHAGMFLTRQLALGNYDWRLHRDHGDKDDYDISQLWNDTWNSIAVTPMPSWGRYAHSFLHVFDGGYAAGYYSYLWAEVLAADVFDEFRSKGIFDRETGLRYLREVLEVGSSRPMSESFKAFRGRDPDPKTLLKKYGLRS
jgi:oligopeptidase A